MITANSDNMIISILTFFKHFNKNNIYFVQHFKQNVMVFYAKVR